MYDLLCTARGRPRLDVTDVQLRALFHQGFTAPAMAESLGCSASYIYDRLYSMGLKMRDRYTNVTDQELSQQVSDLQTQFPNCGVEVKKDYISKYCSHLLHWLQHSLLVLGTGSIRIHKRMGSGHEMSVADTKTRSRR